MRQNIRSEQRSDTDSKHPSNIPGERKIVAEQNLDRSLNMIIVAEQEKGHTKSDKATLKSTKSMSSCAVRSIEWMPSKSRATTTSFCVGVTDSHAPSVHRIAEPANDVSTKWLRA